MTASRAKAGQLCVTGRRKSNSRQWELTRKDYEEAIMADRLVVQLVEESAIQEKSKPKKHYAVIVMLLVGGFLGGLGAGIKNSIWPRLPDSLTPIEAARILKGQQGFAGYSLIKTEGGDGGLGHDIYCPYCGNPIAEVRVSFLSEREPKPGSRMAILTDLARPAIAATAKRNQPTTSTQVVAYRGDVK